MEIFYIIVSAISGIAGILAWVAKIKWSNEFSLAKNAEIQAKEAQIDTLKSEIQILHDFNSIKIREYFLSTKESLEEYISELEIQLNDSKKEIKTMTSLIDSLTVEKGEDGVEKNKLIAERDDMVEKVKNLEELLNKKGVFTPFLSSDISSAYQWLNNVTSGSVVLSESTSDMEQVRIPENTRIFLSDLSYSNRKNENIVYEDDVKIISIVYRGNSFNATRRIKSTGVISSLSKYSGKWEDYFYDATTDTICHKQ